MNHLRPFHKEFQILIVDDDSLNIDILVEALQDEYRLAVAKTGEKALAIAQTVHPDLVLLDIMMPGMDGYEVCRQLKYSGQTQDIAVIFLTAKQDIASKTKGFELGAVDYITKPFNTTEIRTRTQTHLSLARMQRELANQNILLQSRVEEKTNQIRNILKSIIQIMAQMAETRDPYTAGHQQRVSVLAAEIAKKLGLPEDTI